MCYLKSSIESVRALGKEVRISIMGRDIQEDRVIRYENTRDADFTMWKIAKQLK